MLVAYAGDPSAPSDGDLWYDSTAGELTARVGGANVTLGAPGAGGAPTSADYLVGTSNGSLSGEIVVGTTPGGELGGTWAAPTLDDGVTVTGWELGASTATTATANDNDTSLATTAYVQTELTAYASDTVTFSNKSATTPTAGDNDTSVATTAFVTTAVSGLGGSADSLTATHASPSTTNPLSPTWTTNTHDIFYGVAGTINLPAASSYAGKRVLIYNTGAFTVDVNPSSTEVIVRDGTVQAGGTSMTLSSGAGNYVTMLCDGVRWISLMFKGTLAEGTADTSAGWFDNGTFAATDATSGVANEAGAGGAYGGPVTPSSSGTCTKLRVYIQHVNTNGTTLKAALYTSGGTLLSSGTATLLTSTVNQFYEVTLAVPQSVTASTTYIVGYMVSTAAAAQGRHQAGQASGSGKFAGDSYASFPTTTTWSNIDLKMLVGMWVQ